MTTVKQLGNDMVEAVADFVRRSLVPVDARLKEQSTRQESTDQLIADLERRVAELEANK
jgi:hypothetical protein